MAAAFATLFYVVVMFGGFTSLFRDSDAGWHIRNGERILATFRLPTVDPYSFSRAGQPWVSWEWLSDSLSAAIHASFGLGGVAALYSLAIAATVWLWFRLHWTADGNFLLACLFAAPMLSTTNLHWLARPHVFGWIFLLIAVQFAEALPRRLDTGTLLCVGLFTALWANMHASFFLGTVIMVVYAAGHWAHSVLWEDEHVNRAQSYLALAGASLAGSFLNPVRLESAPACVRLPRRFRLARPHR